METRESAAAAVSGMNAAGEQRGRSSEKAGERNSPIVYHHIDFGFRAKQFIAPCQTGAGWYLPLTTFLYINGRIRGRFRMASVFGLGGNKNPMIFDRDIHHRRSIRLTGYDYTRAGA